MRKIEPISMTITRKGLKETEGRKKSDVLLKQAKAASLSVTLPSFQANRPPQDRSKQNLTFVRSPFALLRLKRLSASMTSSSVDLTVSPGVKSKLVYATVMPKMPRGVKKRGVDEMRFVSIAGMGGQRVL